MEARNETWESGWARSAKWKHLRVVTCSEDGECSEWPQGLVRHQLELGMSEMDYSKELWI